MFNSEMIGWKGKVFVVLALLLVFVGSGDFGFRDWSWKQKLTIEVNTPDGVKSGSSVVKASFGWDPKWWGMGDSAGSMHGDIDGESVVVDLGNGHYLMNLLNENDESQPSEAFFPENTGKRDEVAELYDWMLEQRDTRPLPPKNYPVLVTFDDIDFPETIRVVDPANLAGTFGQGFSLKSMTIAITDEPVTWGVVEQVLPCVVSDHFCVPLDKNLPYGHPLRNVRNTAFRR